MHTHSHTFPHTLMCPPHALPQFSVTSAVLGSQQGPQSGFFPYSGRLGRDRAGFWISCPRFVLYTDKTTWTRIWQRSRVRFKWFRRFPGKSWQNKVLESQCLSLNSGFTPHWLCVWPWTSYWASGCLGASVIIPTPTALLRAKWLNICKAGRTMPTKSFTGKNKRKKELFNWNQH